VHHRAAAQPIERGQVEADAVMGAEKLSGVPARRTLIDG